MPTEHHQRVIISRKRRAQEPASSPRSYKQPRLSPQVQNAGLSQTPEEKESKMDMLFSWGMGLLAGFSQPVRDQITFILKALVPSSDPLSTNGEVSDEEYIVVTTPRSISPGRIRKQSHGSVRSTSGNTFSSIEEVPFIPFDGPVGDSQSTPKGHRRSSSSITTTYPNTQLSTSIEHDPVEHFLVENMCNIRIDSSHSSLQSSQITSSSFSRGSTVQSKETSTSRKTRPRRRPHIDERKFKLSVREAKREALNSRMYHVKKHHRELIKGHLKVAMGFADYQLLLHGLGVEDRSPPSRFVRGLSPGMSRPYYGPKNRMKRTLDNAKATLNSPKPLTFVLAENDRKLLERQKDAAIEARLRGFPDQFPPKEEEEVNVILRKRGLVARVAREQVSDVDISRLNPGQWLNDEIINFYGAMILARSEANKENAQAVSKGGEIGSLDVHYFSSFFWDKLCKEGYERGRLAKWTKKVNIFSKDVVLIPINHSNAHWTAAAINFRKKRIESYDSMGVAKRMVFTHLRAYLDAEHRDKKKKPFDFTGWEDIAPEDTPQQANGWDCGVFTCHFLEAISRGVEKFVFCQPHMPYLRRRMIWEIGNAQLRSPDYK